MRTVRLQRASRLFRLARIGRLAKLTAMKKSLGPIKEHLRSFLGALCGSGCRPCVACALSTSWWAYSSACTCLRVASTCVQRFMQKSRPFQEPSSCLSQDTWLARRYVDPEGSRNLLLEDDPGVQWLHAMRLGISKSLRPRAY